MAILAALAALAEFAPLGAAIRARTEATIAGQGRRLGEWMARRVAPDRCRTVAHALYAEMAAPGSAYGRTLHTGTPADAGREMMRAARRLARAR